MLIRCILLSFTFSLSLYSQDFFGGIHSETSHSGEASTLETVNFKSIELANVSSGSAVSMSGSIKLTAGDFGASAWLKFDSFQKQEIPGKGLEPFVLASNLATENLYELTQILQSLEKSKRRPGLHPSEPDHYLNNHYRNLRHADRNLKKMGLKPWQLNLQQLMKLRTDGVLDSQNNVSDVWITKNFLQVWQSFQSKSLNKSARDLLNLVWQRSTDYVAQALPTTNGNRKDTSPRTSIDDISEWCQMWDMVRRGELSFPFHSVAKRNFIQFQGNIKSAFKYGTAMPTYLGLVKQDLLNLLTLRRTLDKANVQKTLHSLRNMSEDQFSSTLLQSFKVQTLGLDLFDLAGYELMSDQLNYVYEIWENSKEPLDYPSSVKRLELELTESDLAELVRSIETQTNDQSLKELESRIKSAKNGFVASEKVFTEALEKGLNAKYFKFHEGRIILKSEAFGETISDPRVRVEFEEQFRILSESIRTRRVDKEGHKNNISVLNKDQNNSSYRQQYLQMLENRQNIDYVVLDRTVKGVVYDAPNGLFVRHQGYDSSTRKSTRNKVGKLANGTHLNIKHVYLDSITGRALFYSIDAASESVQKQLYSRYRKGVVSLRPFVAADYVKLNERVDIEEIKTDRDLENLKQQRTQQMKTRLTKIISDLETSIAQFEELGFDARKENQFVEYQANGWNPFGKQKQAVIFISSAYGMLLVRDLHQTLTNLQEQEEIAVNNEEEGLASAEDLFENELMQKGVRINCAWRYSVCIESVTERLESLRRSLQLISIE